MGRFLSLTLLLLMAVPICSASHNSYRVDLALKPESRQLRSTAIVTFAAPVAGTSVRFLLNKSLKVTKVACTNCEGFRFATDEPSSFRYMPDGAPLYIALNKAVKAGDEMQVTISYEGSLNELAWGVNMLTPEYVELAQYIGWYPFMPEMGKFHYAIDVTADPAYTVTGEGIATGQSRGRWRIVEDADTFDMVVVAGRALKTRALRGSNLQVTYSPAIPDAAAGQILEQMDQTVKTYSLWFGAPSGGHLTLLLNERTNGGSYVRPGFVSMPYVAGSSAEVRRRIVATLGHEVGHLWWTGASATTWEDWLNESFAEYSSWLMLKQVYGNEEFEKQIARSRERTKGKPAVWGIDRNADEAYFVLYDKGALLLDRLASRMGEKQFLAFASQIAHLTPRTTAEFLTKLEKTTTPEIRRDFEASLKE
jgi:hypothetical protein